MSFCSWFGGEKYRDHFEKGVYACSSCEAELFHSSKKYEHQTPWPAFSDPVTQDCLSKRQESPTALKVSCAKCGNGLGHEFLGDGPKKDLLSEVKIGFPTSKELGQGSGKHFKKKKDGL